MKSKNTSIKSLNQNSKENFFKNKINPSKLEEMLKNNPSIINSINEKGETLLSNSLNKNNFEIYNLLLNSPLLDLRFKDNEGNSYLHLAVLNQKENVLKELIKKGINLNMQNKNGDTALHLAYKYGFDSIIKILTYNGINTLIKNNDNKVAKEIKQVKMNNNNSDYYNNFLNKTEKIYIKQNKLPENIFKIERKHGTASINNLNYKLKKMNVCNDPILKLYTKKYRNNHYFIIKKNKEPHDKVKDKNNNLKLNSGKINNDNMSILESCNLEEDKNIKIMSFKEYNNKTNIEEDSSTKNIDNNLLNNTSKETKFITDTKEKSINLDDISSFAITQSIESKKFEKKNINELNNKYLLSDKSFFTGKKPEQKIKTITKNCKSYVNLNKANPKKWNTIQNIYSQKNTSEKNTTGIKSKIINKINSIKKSKSKKKNQLFNNKIINKTMTKAGSKSYNSFVFNTNKKNHLIKKINFEKNNIKINPILRKRNINRVKNIKNKESTFEQESSKENTKKLSLFVNQISTKSSENKINKIDENGLTLKSGRLLKNFLSQIFMEKYLHIFAMNGFDDINLILEQSKNGVSSIQDNELKEAGIKIPGDRAKILIRIQEISNNFNFPIPKEVYYVIESKNNLENDKNIKKLKEWLKYLKVEKFLNNFINNGYFSIELLLIQMASSNPITNEILKDEIGIEKVGYRSRIINKLNDDSKKYISELEVNMLVMNKGEEQIKTNNCQCILF